MNKIKLFFIKNLKLTGTFSGVYYQKGVQPFGLTKIKEDYYFFNKRHDTLKGIDHFISKEFTNDLLIPGIYTFDNTGKIVNPTDPRFPGGIPSKSELEEKLKVEHARLKKIQSRDSHKKSNHYKLSEYQLSKCDDFAEVLTDAWVRKINQEKLNYKAKEHYKRNYSKKDLVDYIRHKCSNYDLYLGRWNCYTDNREYYHYVLKRNYIILIGNVYNNLQSVCNQMNTELDREFKYESRTAIGR